MIIAAAGGTGHWLTSPGGLNLRTAHWPHGDRGVVIVLQGRGEFIEQYLEPIAELQRRGYAVSTLDWRGQGASTRLLPDRTRSHVGRFDDYLDDLARLLEGVVLPNRAGRPLILLGQGMGAHIGLHMMARRPELFSRAILCSPMIDLPRGPPIRRAIGRMATQAVCLIPTLRTRGKPPVELDFDDNPMTTCPDRYEADAALLRDTPDLGVGPPTWGWRRAALASIVALRDPAIVHKVGIPVLMAVPDNDPLMDHRATRRLALKLRRGKVFVLNGARHRLLREQDAFRLPLWEAIDDFLEGAG